MHISYVAVHETFVQLTFIRHKMYHFSKVNVLSKITQTRKVSDANGTNIHHCSHSYIERMGHTELNAFSGRDSVY